MAAIGMSVPGLSDLGMGLGDQVGAETEEQRKKRLLQISQSRVLPSATAGASALGLSSTGYSSAFGGGL